MNIAYLRFYEELNDFLPKEKRKISFPVSFPDHPSVKSLIESENVPHTEIDLILVNGQSVTFLEKVKDGDRISVYPVFESLDIRPVSRLRPMPLREPGFVLDVHLGKLARYLRMLGFDTLYRNDYSDDRLSEISVADKRCILTRDLKLLMRKEVERGYWVRSTSTSGQMKEIIQRFDLKNSIRLFTICTSCNGKLALTSESHVKSVYPSHEFYLGTAFYQCTQCRHFYWNGSHSERFLHLVNDLLKGSAGEE